MFLGVSMPVKFLNLTSFGGGGPSKEDRLGGGASRPSRSGFEGIVCVAMVLSGGKLLQVKRVRTGGWNWRGVQGRDASCTHHSARRGAARWTPSWTLTYLAVYSMALEPKAE